MLSKWCLVPDAAEQAVRASTLVRDKIACDWIAPSAPRAIAAVCWQFGDFRVT